MITLQNMIFANPQAYQVFPNMVNPYNTGTTELARYTGHLAITDNNGNTYDFTGTSTIDFTSISGLVTIDNITDRGSVRLGRWQIPQSIVITNDITITVTIIAEVSSDGATITPQYEVKYNTYHNGELTEFTVITPDNVTLQSNVEWITISNNQIVVAANTNTEARQGQVTIQVSYQEYNTSANYNIIQAGYSIEDGIMDAMVLWYDLAKQGATNESMATTPTLIDHSGNGHDATCYNFAWSGMSGIGGFDYPLFPNVFSSDGFCNIPNNRYYTRLTDVSDTTYSIKFKVSKMSNGKTLYVRKVLNGGVSTSLLSIITENGEYSFTVDSGYLAVYPSERSNPEGVYNADIDIQLVPLYPNALVSDGVDDYCFVEGLPLLTKERGYTVIAKRKWLDEDNEGNSSLITKASTTSGVDGAFMFECKHQNATQKITRSFGGTLILDNFYTDDITYQISNSYNSTSIPQHTYTDTNKMVMFRFSTNANEYYGEFALYSLLLFNRDLTPEEIEWVKTNLIEAE